MIGRTISHYRIVGELGKGGMGVVYAAQDIKLGRKVAIKVLSEDVASDEERMRRFVREAQAASAVNHPNIATIYEIDEFEGMTFIAMEFVEGETLRPKIEGSPMPFTEVLAIAKQLAGALGKAHELGIVHRDIKPENIIVREDGLVKILDFGLAKLLPDSPGAGDAKSLTLTQDGMIMGTARYMSPEQARGEAVNAASDVFSVGSVLYEMMVGAPAFPGESHFEILYSVVNEAPQPISDELNLSESFKEVLARALAKSPADRYQDCSALAEGLEQLEATASAPASAVSGPSSDRVWETATGVISTARVPAKEAEPLRSLAVLPFRNISGNPDADWMRAGMQEMLSSDLAHVPDLRVVPSDRLGALLTDLKLGPGSTFDDVTLKSVGEFLSVDTVVTGSFVKLGPAARVDVSIRRPSTGEEIHIKAEAHDESQLLGVVAHLAAEVRRTIVGEEKRDLVVTMVGEKGSQNAEAIKAYVDGLSRLHQGNNLEAIDLLSEAVAQDGEFALAYTYLGEALANAGRKEEARDTLKRALDRSEGLQRADRLFVTAREAMAAGEISRAIEAFELLTQLLPNNMGAFYELAQAYELEGQWDRALACLKRVIEFDPKFVAALFALGRVNIKKGSYQQALDYLYRALSLNVLLGNEEGRAAVLNAIGLAHFWLDKYDEALRYYQESLAIKEGIGDRRGLSATLSNMAVVYQVRGDYGRSISTYEEALGISEELGDEQGIAETFINIGTIYEEQGNLDEALANYKRALKTESELGDRMAEILCLNDIGNIYLTQGKVDDAEVYFDRALDARRQLGERNAIAITLNYLGNIERLRGRYDRAVAKYLESLKISREIGWKSGEAESLGCMGAAMAAQGRYRAGLESHEEARGIYEELGDKNGLAISLAARSKVECALGDCGRAVGTAARAEELAREVGSDDLIADALLAGGMLELLSGRAPGAVDKLSEAREHAEASGARITLLTVMTELGRALCEAGRPDEALTVLAKTVEEARGLGLGSIAARAESHQAEAILEKGNAEAARDTAMAAAAQADSMGDRELFLRASCVLARAAAKAGDRPAAAGAASDGPPSESAAGDEPAPESVAGDLPGATGVAGGSSSPADHAMACLRAAASIAGELGEWRDTFLARPDISGAISTAVEIVTEGGRASELADLGALGLDVTGAPSDT